MPLPFRDRHDAGRQLSDRILEHVDGSRMVVLGVPRGGVPVAYEVAHSLRAPLDIFLLRHLVAAGDPALTIGVIGSGGVRVMYHDLIMRAGLSPEVVDEITQRERISLIARERTYRGQAMERDLLGRTAILVDDGSSPDHLLAEYVDVLRQHEPSRVVLAVPVLSAESLELLEPVADAVVCVVGPGGCAAPERWHREFLPISHTEVRALLTLAIAEAQSRELASAT
jgi:putative phosphoribosyl transferase